MAEEYGGITQSGQSGSYTYAVLEAKAKKPLNYVTWETAVRYANWLTNGQGDGDTEQGSYTIENGAVTVPDHSRLAVGNTIKHRPINYCPAFLPCITAERDDYFPDATVIYRPMPSGCCPASRNGTRRPYYDPDKSGGAGYWLYPTQSDNAPEANINSNAPCDVGPFAASPYGTYSQAGNVWEYNDTRSGNKIGVRGGSFYIDDNEAYLRATTRYDVHSAKYPNYGFRVVALGVAEEK